MKAHQEPCVRLFDITRLIPMSSSRISEIAGWMLLLAAISGCASADRVAVTKFEPIRTEANAQFFKFTAFADAVYPVYSKEAEQTRIHWLERCLKTTATTQRNMKSCHA